MRDDAAELGEAIAALAQALQGTVEHAAAHGLAALPRPSFLEGRGPDGAGRGNADPHAAVDVAAPFAKAAPQAVAVPPPPDEAPRPAAAAPAPPPAVALRAPAPESERSERLRGVAGGVDETGASIRGLLARQLPAHDALKILESEIIGDCRRCKLHRGRTKLVFGVGSPKARVVFVGEGPGADEDRQGVPFVGRAGQLLTKMIEAMGLARDDVYICNVVKCRPPNNRDPEPDEVESCEGFLRAQIAMVQPQVVVTLGRHAAQALLRTQRPITTLRGTWHRYEGVDVMPTFHPSFLLRAPDKKREAWSDLQQVMAKLGLSGRPPGTA